MKQNIGTMFKMGVFKQETNPYLYPEVLYQNKDISYLAFVDRVRLYDIIVSYYYYIKYIKNWIDSMGNSKYMYTLDYNWRVGVL